MVCKRKTAVSYNNKRIAPLSPYLFIQFHLGVGFIETIESRNVSVMLECLKY